MKFSKEVTESAAFFGVQMLVHVIRNLVANGLLHEGAIRTNIQETIDQGTVVLGPEHHAALVELAQSFEEAVRRGSDVAEKIGRTPKP